MTRPFVDRLARQVAHAAATFEHMLLGRSPASVSVVATRDWMVVNLHESLSCVERRLAACETGAQRVRSFHRYVFEHALDSFVEHVRETTGVHLRGAMSHVDIDTGSVLKTYTTHPDVDLFLFGEGLPALGVPVDAHIQASRPAAAIAAVAHRNGPFVSGGIGAARA